MARILLGPTLSDARGQVGGVVYSRNKAGHYIRTNVSPIQPRTSRQIDIRARITQVAQYWKNTLTAALRDAWADYAAQTPLTDRFGARAHISGIAMFTRFNAMWLYAGKTIVTTAPTTPGEASMIALAYTGTTADGIKVTTPDPAIAASDFVFISKCSAPVSQAKNFYNGPWQYFKAIDSVTVYPYLIVAPALVAIGQRWFFRAKYFAASGKVGPTSTGYVDIIA